MSGGDGDPDLAPPPPPPSSPPPPIFTIQVKFSGRTIPVSLSPDSTIKDLKSLPQPLTNVLQRGQKLIFKGKVLVDTVTLRSAEVINGSKLMLMASQGLHQGDGPITKESDSAPAKLNNADRIVLCDDLQTLIDNKNMESNDHTLILDNKNNVTVDKSRSDRWKVIGVIGLSECHLKIIPEEVWSCGSSIRILDISKNSIREVPFKIGSLSSMQKLYLNSNDILDGCISWEDIASLKSLTFLSVSQNHLTILPAALGALTSLRHLDVSNNKLTSLPAELGLLTELHFLKANNNRLSSVPSCVGNCNSLIEFDLSSNLLVELPETLGNLQNLKALHLRNNGLKSLPSTLFKMCSQLSTLDLHGTDITIDLLRQFEGWEEFDGRRRLKHQKQLDFSAGCFGGFDEGADKN